MDASVALPEEALPHSQICKYTFLYEIKNKIGREFGLAVVFTENKILNIFLAYDYWVLPNLY